MTAIIHCLWALLAMLHAPHAEKPRSDPPKPRVAPPRANRGAPRTSPNWAALRRCESGGNYANKRNPTYRGAYQFSRSTWRSVGGTGDPADAPPAEQDMRAAMLLARSGRGQWPVCGRLL